MNVVFDHWLMILMFHSNLSRIRTVTIPLNPRILTRQNFHYAFGEEFWD